MKTGRAALNIYKTFDLHRTPNIRRAPDIRKAANIRKILVPLDSCNGTHGVSKVCKDKAGRPILDVEEVTISLSINAKG
jgi:hypothetical protein